MSFLQPIAEIVIHIPPPLEDVDKDKSELLTLRKEIEALKLMHEQKSKGAEVKVDSTKVKQEVNPQSGDGMSPLHFLMESTRVLRRQIKTVGHIGDP